MISGHTLEAQENGAPPATPPKPVTLHFYRAAVWHTAELQVRMGRTGIKLEKVLLLLAESRVEAGHLC